MTAILYAPSNVPIATVLADLSAANADTFRTLIVNRYQTLDAKIQSAQAFGEQLAAQFGNGAISGGTISAGTGLQVTLTAFAAIVGNIVGYTGTRTIPDVGDDGLAISTTNYLFLRQDGTFTINSTGTAPTDINVHGQALLWGTVITSASAVTAVTNVRRLFGQNLSTLLIVAATPGNTADGDCWYNSTDNKMYVQSGATVRATAALT